jgi:hypothetical protein
MVCRLAEAESAASRSRRNLRPTFAFIFRRW